LSLIKVMSGGQTGADIAGLRAAHKAGIETGGWAPKGFITEAGPRAFLGKLYGLKEHRKGYHHRTIANVLDSDMTIIVAQSWSPGSTLTREACFKHKRPVFHVHTTDFDDKRSKEEVLRWILPRPHEVINIAGNRESVSPGIEKAATEFLYELFMVLK